MRPYSGSIAFNSAVSRLNGKNLRDLWLTHSLLSLLEFIPAWQGGYNVLFPWLNFRRVNLLGEAILASKALDYKEPKFTSVDLAFVFDNLSETVDYRDIVEGEGTPDEKILAFIASMGNAQFRFQEDDLRERLGRAFALYEVFPRRYEKQLRQKHRGHFIDVPGEFEARFGLSVKDFLLVALDSYCSW